MRSENIVWKASMLL